MLPASNDQPAALALQAAVDSLDVGPQWRERHHVTAWHDGGTTDLANLTLVCRYHHHEFAQRGWQSRINTDGLPVWIPPTWIDRQQRPILNTRITIGNWDPQDPLDFERPRDAIRRNHSHHRTDDPETTNSISA